MHSTKSLVFNFLFPPIFAVKQNLFYVEGNIDHDRKPGETIVLRWSQNQLCALEIANGMMKIAGEKKIKNLMH